MNFKSPRNCITFNASIHYYFVLLMFNFVQKQVNLQLTETNYVMNIIYYIIYYIL